MRSRRSLLTNGSAIAAGLSGKPGFRHQLTHGKARCATARYPQQNLLFEGRILKASSHAKALRLSQIGQRLRIEHTAAANGSRR